MAQWRHHPLLSCPWNFCVQFRDPYDSSDQYTVLFEKLACVITVAVPITAHPRGNDRVGSGCCVSITHSVSVHLRVIKWWVLHQVSVSFLKETGVHFVGITDSLKFIFVLTFVTALYKHFLSLLWTNQWSIYRYLLFANLLLQRCSFYFFIRDIYNT